MLADNPLLTLLGRRGRGAIVAVFLREPERTWNATGLGAAARVHPVVAGRAVRELAAVGAVETLRPGRDLVVRWRAAAPAARFLGSLAVPDLRDATRRAFASAYAGPGHVLRWEASGETRADPLVPTHLAIRADDEDGAWDAVGPALDAVRAAGLPAPEVSVHSTLSQSQASPR